MASVHKVLGSMHVCGCVCVGGGGAVSDRHRHNVHVHISLSLSVSLLSCMHSFLHIFCVHTKIYFACSVHRYETVNVHLKRKPSWLLERNPKGRVPVLEHPDGRIVFESIVVCQYLDEIYPNNRLTPTDPYRKARDRLLMDYCDKVCRKLQSKCFHQQQIFTQIFASFKNAAPNLWNNLPVSRSQKHLGL